MTPEQVHDNVFLLTSVGGALLVETLGWVRAPERIAATALVPLSSRRIPMGPRRFERQGVRFGLGVLARRGTDQ